MRDLLMKLYLHGLSQGDFALAIRGLLGEGVPLSAASIERLRADWRGEYAAWRTRRFDDRELVYAWDDGICVKAELETKKAALLVVIGTLSDGRKEVLAVVPGYRESTTAWAAVLRDLHERGLCAPKPMVADGSLGVCGAVREIWPETAEQRCWNHKIVNVLDELPKKAQPEARDELTAIPYAPTHAQPEGRRDALIRRHQDRYPAAAACPGGRRRADADIPPLPGGALASSADNQRRREPLRGTDAANRCGEALPQGHQCNVSDLEGAHGRREDLPSPERTEAR